MKLREDIKEFINTIPHNVHLVATTKYVDSIVMREMYSNGIKCFGENRVESFLEKYDSLSDLIDIEWHFIGHLQRNKALKVIDKINCLDSLDSLLLADIIDKNRKTPLDVLVEISINLEESKSGVPYKDALNFIHQLSEYKNIHIKGLMMMAIKGSSSESLVKQFTALKNLRDKIERTLNISLPILSMGMSDDYKIAIDCGSNEIRLGRILYK